MTNRRSFLRKVAIFPAFIAFSVFAKENASNANAINENVSADSTSVRQFSLLVSTYDTLFKHGDANDIIRLLVDPILAHEENAMWKGRAESMIRCVVLSLVELRDLGALEITPSVIREYLILGKLTTLESDIRISDVSQSAVKQYLNALPGFRQGGQGSDVQHGFLTMQFSRTLNRIERGVALT